MTNIRSNLVDEVPSVIQFENANEGRSYPFSDNATLVSSDGKPLPDSLITDMHLIVPHGSKPYLSSVYLSRNMVSVCVRIVNVDKELSLFKSRFDFSLVRELLDADTIRTTKEEFNRLLAKLKALNFHARGTDAMSVVIRASEFEPYRPYRLEPMTGSEDFGGVITFGSVDFPEVPVTYRFDDGAIPVTEGAIARYEPARVRKFVDPRTGESVSGDVSIRFSAHVLASKEGNGVKLGLTEAAKTALLSDCERKRPPNACGAPLISSINGVEPDKDSRLVIWFH